MDKTTEILDYVMNTPNNTNRAVLKSKLAGLENENNIDMTNYYDKNIVDEKLAEKANNDEVVHLDNDETITGVKTFNSRLASDQNGVYVRNKNDRIDRGETERTTSDYSYYEFCDKNGKSSGGIVQSFRNNKARDIKLFVFKDNSTFTASTQLGYNGEGKEYWYMTEQLVPADDSDDRSIVCTKWVNKKLVPINEAIANTYSKDEVNGLTNYASETQKGTVRAWTTVEDGETVLNIATED